MEKKSCYYSNETSMVDFLHSSIYFLGLNKLWKFECASEFFIDLC